ALLLAAEVGDGFLPAQCQALASRHRGAKHAVRLIPQWANGAELRIERQHLARALGEALRDGAGVFGLPDLPMVFLDLIPNHGADLHPGGKSSQSGTQEEWSTPAVAFQIVA